MTASEDILMSHTISAGSISIKIAQIGPPPDGDVPDPHRVRRNALLQAEKLNDNAYFLMIFARFDSLIRHRTRELVEAACSQPDWRLARSWTILDPEKLDFLRCVALLTNQSEADYGYIKALYRDRSRVAHGGLLDEKPEVVIISQRLQDVLGRLQDTQ